MARALDAVTAALGVRKSTASFGPCGRYKHVVDFSRYFALIWLVWSVSAAISDSLYQDTAKSLVSPGSPPRRTNP
ncbi:hypothetical protein FA13DRAFT_1734830 [Coprinellus micaceus]|uniref:Uncharacterized protein n=1 Tax=Coprinellus micaceus TaxID=71717 RepID=A0A4Y7T6F2_COPMI|nr:hypothetical protein FA13DRAFT_1734830 [Coprinellus micaceus]